MKKKELLRTIKYLLVAASAGLIEFGSYTVLHVFTNLPYWPCYLTGLVLSVLWNFTLNRRYTFRSNNNIPVAMLKVACYYAVFTPLTTIGGNYLAETRHWNGFLVTILNMLLNCLTEYLYQRFFVFGKSIDTRETDEESSVQSAKTDREELSEENPVTE